MRTLYYESHKDWNTGKLQYLRIYRDRQTDKSTISDHDLFKKILDGGVVIDFKKFKLEFWG
jgi:hypothetical protein